MDDVKFHTGIVVIGRNEEMHLPHSLPPLIKISYPLVYVDSDSSDRSVAIARSLGVDVVQLNSGQPLTPSRGRNEGFAYLMRKYPKLEWIQFVDGDCAFEPHWFETAQKYLTHHPDVAVVAGLLKEREEQASFYKRLSAMEWQSDPGEVKATGGNFMMRASVFQEVGGFNNEIPGAEDNELCYRVRALGGKVMSIEQPMAEHDSKLSSFGDFWRRCERTGYAYAQVSRLHWGSPEALFVKEILSTILLGGIIPLLALGLIPWTGGWSLILLCVYPLLYWRIVRRVKGYWNNKDAHIYAWGCVLGKFPGFIGACRYYWDALLKRK